MPTDGARTPVRLIKVPVFPVGPAFPMQSPATVPATNVTGGGTHNGMSTTPKYTKSDVTAVTP